MLRPEFQHLAGIERRRIAMPEGVTMRLSRLEKPEPWPAELQAAIAEALRLDQVQQYPAYNPFYDQLAAFVGVPVDNVVVGAGIEEFIRTLMLLCAGPGDRVAVLWPTCAMFDVYARAFGVELVRIVTDPRNPPSIADVIAHLPYGCKLLFLPNPGQPVETCYSLDELATLADAGSAMGTVLAVDEAYHGFGAPTAVPLVEGHDNVVVMRTFSKAFGAASIRLGYAVAGDFLARSLHAVRQSGEVSSMSMAVASVLMREFERYVAPSWAAICEARDGLRDRINGMGLRAWGSVANHVLIEFPSQEMRDTVRAALAARGILVKADFPEPLERHMLVTCGSPALMGAFYDEFRAACA